MVTRTGNFSGCSHGSVIDISNAYYHVEMAEESKKYLGFFWKRKFYRFNCLPTAPFVFTEVTYPFIRFWRSKGFQVLSYMDDFASGAENIKTQTLHIRFMCEHLISLGWLLQPTNLQAQIHLCLQLWPWVRRSHFKNKNIVCLKIRWKKYGCQQ